MIADEDARIPFAVIGILMIILSTVTAVYLLRSESSGVTNGLDDQREAQLNDALALARADIDSSLNSACIFAQAEVGRTPVINVSDACPYTGDADDVNMARVKDLTLQRLSLYLGENYGGNFAYGDYRVSASVCDDYREVSIEPVSMNISRLSFALTPCQDKYDTYYILTVPVSLTVSSPGTAFNYSETYASRTLVTSRYPLLENMTTEYEMRLNGTPLFADLTAASFAYTWARGYGQYAFGEPMNIVDDKDLALMTNAGVLLEQGNEFNSVDPVALAALMKNTYESSRSTKEVVNEDKFNDLNNYNFTNSSQSTLPNGTAPKVPTEYEFNIDDIVDSAYVSMINGSLYYHGQQITERGMALKGSADGAYMCKMHVAVRRKPVDAMYQNSGTELISSSTFNPPGGIGAIASETWRVHRGPLNGNWTDDVTIDYIVDEYSPLGVIDNNIASPYKPVSFDGFTDPNFANAVSSYKSSTDMNTVLFSRGNNNWTSKSKEITSNYNHWVENYTVCTLDRTSALIKGDIGVSLNIDDYGSYQEMMESAYAEMERQFERNLSKYQNSREYRTLDAYGNVQTYGFKSCGAKAIDYVLNMYLGDIEYQLNYTVSQAPKNVNETVDDRMGDYTDMNSSDLNNNARSSKNFLENTKLYIPFGMAMNLSSQPAYSGNYTWKEDVKLAVDQQPDYLSEEEYTDPETGYRTIPLKARNVCLFSLPTDFLDTEQATGAVLDGIDAVAGTATEMADETITDETTKVVHDLAEGSRERIKTEIRESLLTDVTMEGDLNEDDINNAVDRAFDQRSPERILGDLKNGTLQREIAKDLGDRAKVEAAKKLDDYADQYSDYIETRTTTVVEEAEQKAISSTINACKEEVKDAFRDYMAEAADHLESEAIRDALKRIPSGLPLLPPWGWWATMNVWYIDIQGEIPVLTVYDVDNVPVPDPILGHNATAYVRKWQQISDAGGEILGYDEPIRFQQKTCTFILVPPGEQGIGDKIGGWDEKSKGYDT